MEIIHGFPLYGSVETRFGKGESELLYGKNPLLFICRKGKKSREMYNEIDLDKIDLNSEPPAEEPIRQYYFMAKCREWVRNFEREKGRFPTACVTTFGCPNV